MPFVPIPNTAAVEIRMTQDQQLVENTLYFRLGSSLTPTNLTQLCQDLVGWWDTLYSAQASSAVELVEVTATDLTTETGPVGSFNPSTTLLGALTSPALPNNVTIAVSFRTASRGRSFRGRNYFVGLTESQVTDNTLSDPSAAAILDIYQNLLPVGGLFTDDWIWVVASRFSGVNADGVPIPRVTGLSTPITSAVIVDKVIDSSRRRLPGRGR